MNFMTPRNLKGKMTCISFNIYIIEHIMGKTIYSSKEYDTWSTYQ